MGNSQEALKKAKKKIKKKNKAANYEVKSSQQYEVPHLHIDPTVIPVIKEVSDTELASHLKGLGRGRIQEVSNKPTYSTKDDNGPYVVLTCSACPDTANRVTVMGPKGQVVKLMALHSSLSHPELSAHVSGFTYLEK